MALSGLSDDSFIVELQSILCKGQDVIIVLSGRVSQQSKRAKELAATKEANDQLEMEVAQLKEEEAGDCKALAKAQKRIEATKEKLKPTKFERGALSSTLARHDRFFTQKGEEVSAYLSSSLGEVGTHVTPFEAAQNGNSEADFFTWLEAQLPAVPSIIEKSCKVTLLFGAEAALNLLERQDSEHVSDDSREGMSEVVQQAAQCIVAEY